MNLSTISLADGSHQPRVTWTIEGKPLQDDGRVRMMTTRNVSTLVVNQAIRSDTGIYTVFLRNDDICHMTIKVIVVGKRCRCPIQCMG